MQAHQFLDSAQAAQAALFAPGLSVGERIEGAVHATLAVAGCNTNLGIVLLAAPVAAALERFPQARGAAELQAAVQAVLRGLGVEDAAGAFRAIAVAHPGGLGRAETQDVHAAPTLDLRAAMALAAHRDSIAREYADGFSGLFAVGLPAFSAGPTVEAGMLRAFLAFLARWPDSHIVRKQGAALAQTVLKAAAGFEARLVREGAAALSDDLAGWDETLKSQGLNPGTSADLAVASALLGHLVARGTDRD
jgi:triphosphoribosyl-dephospho-CoA synthase